ncbi:MAG: Gfo/Idh/MocA family oxidoreductase [Kiritimatiellae bacterium]|nr:Gfo/Idh/MocA family oxidoreductase [Kiritimatiellia bacterium]
MSTYSVVVVGMGKRGMHHAAAFQDNPSFEVAGICDIDEGRLVEAKEQLGGSVETSTDAAALTAALKPDVFCFCTMPHLRKAFVDIAIENGVKLVAFEKPVADSSTAGKELKAAIDASGIKAVVSHQHRYGPHYTKVKEIVASGALGTIHTIYASTPGWMMHMMTHMIDYMCWYNDYAPAEWAMAQAAGRSKLSDNHPSPDYIGGFIQFANGVRGVVETGAGAPDIPEVAKWWGRNRIRVMGDDGFAEVLTNGGWRSVTASGGLQSGEGAMDYAHDMVPYVQEIADWLDDDAKVHSCSFDRAFMGFEAMMAMCRSALEGGQVALPLETGADEINALREQLGEKAALLGSPEHAAEFGMA